MSDYFSRDILNTISTLLSTNFNTNLAVINTTRTDTTPNVLGFYYDYSRNQFPEGFIIIDSSTISVEEMGGLAEGTTETFTVFVTIAIKSNDTKLNIWIENYIECLYKTLHGYSDSYIMWIVAKDSIRDSVNTKEMQTLKIAGYSFEVITFKK